MIGVRVRVEVGLSSVRARFRGYIVESIGVVTPLITLIALLVSTGRCFEKANTFLT